ncbi:mechanosensitive ion channel family protein [Halorussus rarus]|uniref:mechanosensitive ion channel family protein n=1 Tax=Halorussus rarus TaxID=660515 RepID=UPI000E217E3C|nr:mechanosensitive ion channel family protein [Halorussus sp. JP-T4]
MNVSQGGGFGGIVAESLAELRAGFVDAIPTFVTALLFFVVAYAGIRVALSLVRSALDRVYADELVADLFAAVAGVFMWFGAALALLKILGMGEVAASLGTATGFVALGVSYALSDMIADTVSGVYLLRDPDFEPGDAVVTADETGVVREIGLRKTRLAVDGGDTLVLGNSLVEERWTKKARAGSPAGDSEPTAGDSGSPPVDGSATADGTGTIDESEPTDGTTTDG